MNALSIFKPSAVHYNAGAAYKMHQPLCNAVASDGRGYARTGYTEDRAEVTCKRFLKSIDKLAAKAKADKRKRFLAEQEDYVKNADPFVPEVFFKAWEQWMLYRFAEDFLEYIAKEQPELLSD